MDRKVIPEISFFVFFNTEKKKEFPFFFFSFEIKFLWLSLLVK